MERPGQLDVGIVGYGFAGRQHRVALGHDTRVNKIAVTDIDPEKRAQAQAEGNNTYRNLENLLASHPDILILAIPPASNLDAINRIASYAYHPRAILVEKPIATKINDAEAMEQALKKSGVSAMAGLTGHGFHPEFRRAHEIIKSGALGEIHTIVEQIHLGGPSLPKQYLSDSYGGVIAVNGIHTLDHMVYLTDREDWQVKAARSGNDHWKKEVPDWGEATLFNSDQVSHASWLWPKTFEVGLEGYTSVIVGSLGRLTIMGFDGIRLATANGASEEHFHKTASTIEERHGPGFRAEIKAFFDAIDSNSDFPTPISYAVRLQRLLHEIEQRAADSKKL